MAKKREDLRECDFALIDSEDLELLREAKKHCKFVVILGKNSGTKIREFEDMISDFDLFKSIAERSPDPILIFDEKRVIYSNPKAEEYFGPEALRIRGILDLVHPDYREIAFERMKRVLRGEKVDPVEQLCIMPDGREVWFETNYILINFRDDPAIFLMLRDITEKKKMERELKESNRTYREFFNSSLDIIAVTDLKGNFIEVNKAFEDAFGYSREEVKGKNFAEVLNLGKETAEEIFRSYNKAFKEKKDLLGLIFEVNRKDGRKIIVEGNIRLLRERENITGFVGNYRDVTDRNRLEKKLKESEERYRKIFDNSPILIALANENGTFIEANQAMIKSVGMNPIGRDHYDLFPKEFAERSVQYIREAIEEDKMLVFQDETKGRFFFNQYIPLKVDGKTHCLLIAHEITELLRLNRFLMQVIEVGETLARVRDRESLIKRIEDILSDYSARISEKPEDIHFIISHEEKNYGYLCVKVAGEEERDLFKTLANDLALAFRSIDDEKRKEELYERLSENIRTIAYLVDKIRNPLSVVLAYAELLLENENAKEKIFQQVDRIVTIMKELDVSWLKSEELTGKRII